MKGLVFDIKEFAVHDGPGVRTTVFLKGCPLRCAWCHNPEGLEARPQLMVSTASCTHCGACQRFCGKPPAECTACGKCAPHCPHGLRRICGRYMEPGEVAEAVLKGRALMESSGGGVTFSGGEPMAQWPFAAEVISRLGGLHAAIETSGYAREDWFLEALKRIDLFLFDLKLIDPAKHIRFIGVDNAPILANFALLKASGKPFIARLPVIPGVNDDIERFEATAELIAGAPGLIRAELLPYHATAGAKYGMLGREYDPPFDTGARVKVYTSPFERRGIETRVL